MRKYAANPKHETPGQRGIKGSRMDLSVADATALLNDPIRCIPVPGKRQFVGVLGESIYVFQDDGQGGFHGYPVTGHEVYQKYHGVTARVAALLGIGIKQLSRLED